MRLRRVISAILALIPVLLIAKDAIARTLAAGLAIALAAPAEAATTSWPVEYARGDLAYVAPHKNLTVEVASESIRILHHDESLRTIPGKSIVAVVYDVASHHPVVGYLGGVPNSVSSGGGMGAGMVGALFVVVIPVLLAPVVKAQHFVTLVWKDGDLVRNVTLQMKGKDQQAMLSALSATTGIAWRDAPAERERLSADLDAAKSRSFTFDLDREVSAADTYLDAGTHRAVVLEGMNGPELLVFESSSYKLKHLLLATPVRMEQVPIAGSQNVLVNRRDTPAGSTIKELRVGDRSLTLPDFVVTPPGSPRPVPGTDGRVVEFAFGQYAVGTITRTEYEGEQAFRFQAIRTDFSFSLASRPFPVADLYVSREHVIFDPGEGEAARERRLVLARSAIDKVDSGAMSQPPMVRLTAGKEKHSFRLIAPGRGQPASSAWRPGHGRTVLVETRLADFVRLAIRDFDAAVSLYDGWLAGVPTLAPAEEDRQDDEDAP